MSRATLAVSGASPAVSSTLCLEPVWLCLEPLRLCLGTPCPLLQLWEILPSQPEQEGGREGGRIGGKEEIKKMTSGRKVKIGNIITLQKAQRQCPLTLGPPPPSREGGVVSGREGDIAGRELPLATNTHQQLPHNVTIHTCIPAQHTTDVHVVSHTCTHAHLHTRTHTHTHTRMHTHAHTRTHTHTHTHTHT